MNELLINAVDPLHQWFLSLGAAGLARWLLIKILLIAVPLTIQTFLIFFIAYFASKALKLRHDIAAPAGMIGASNFFELAVAVAISLFGAQSPVALATIVGVLVEVPVMLALVKIANRTKGWFPA